MLDGGRETPGPGRKITVVVVNWNGERFLERCLASLAMQTLRPHEILLVDNASTDGSLQVARRFPDVRVIELNENCGFARGNNLAAKLASQESDWIALLNPDAFAEPDWLEELLSAALRNPDVRFFGSRLINAGQPSLLDGVGDVYHVSGLVWRAGHGRPVGDMPSEEREIFSPCAAAAMYGREIFLAAQGFDEDYFCYVEDVDLGFRLRLAGLRCLYVPSSVALHMGSAVTGGQHSDFAIYHGHRNLVWTYVKNMPGWAFWLFLPFHFAMNLVSIAVFAWRGKGGVIFRAKRDALRGLAHAWRKRREIQSGRRATVRQVLRVLDFRGLGLFLPR